MSRDYVNLGMSWMSKIIQAKCFHLETYDGSAGHGHNHEDEYPPERPFMNYKSSLNIDIKNLV